MTLLRSLALDLGDISEQGAHEVAAQMLEDVLEMLEASLGRATLELADFELLRLVGRGGYGKE